MAQAVGQTPRDQIRGVCHQDTRWGVSQDSKTSNSIVQLRKIPHSQTKFATQPEGFGLMATSVMYERKATQQGMSTANLEMQSFGVGKCLNLVLLWCRAAKVCGRAHITGYVFAFTRPSMPVT
jgi:hypothetical protein